MINEEFDILYDSSESSEHANLPRASILHETPELFNITRINVAKSIRLPKSNNIINKLKKNEEKKSNIEDSNNIKNNTLKSRNSQKFQMINLEDKKINNNFISYKKSHAYEKILINTNTNENKLGKENRRSCLLKNKRIVINKSKDFSNSNNKKIEKTFEKKKNKRIENSNKLKDSNNTKTKKNILRSSEVLFNNKMIKINNYKRNTMGLTRNNSKEMMNRTNSEIRSRFNLMRKLNLKSNVMKENNIEKFFKSSKVLDSFKFDLIKPKKKKNINKSHLRLSQNKKNIEKKVQKFTPKLTLPIDKKQKNKVKEINKKDNTIEKINIKNSKTRNKIRSKIIKEKEDENKNNISSNLSHSKIEYFKTEMNNFKQIKNHNFNKEKNIKEVRSFKNVLKEENKFNIKSHYVLSKAGKDEYGQMKINQDTYLFIQGINGVKDFNIFGVLDGHGPEGHFVSQLVSRYIQLEFQRIKSLDKIKDVNIIYEKLSSNNFSIIKDIFINADNFLRDQEIESKNSGTTCVLVIHIGFHIICANAGDSRAILIYDKNKEHDYKVFPLSVDSKPELKEEKERIKKMGGKVGKIKNQYGKEIGPYRVWVKSKDYPGLAMSRSIGDFNGKNIGIIPDPQIIETNFGININYIVVCSDGVWEFLKNDDIMLLGNKYYEENNPRGLCKEIVDYSTKCWQKEDSVIDDITILTVFF